MAIVGKLDKTGNSFAEDPQAKAGTFIPGTSTLDCRPILRHEDEGIWEKVAEHRDAVYAMLEGICEKQKVRCQVLRSAPYEFPATVAVSLWVPRGHILVTERSSLVVTIHPAPFFQYEIEYDVRVKARGRAQCYPRLWRLTEEHLESLVNYLLRRGDLPTLNEHALRRHWFQLWHPKNQARGLRWDCLDFLRRPRLIRSSGKPEGEPRQLRLVDGWHQTLFRQGADARDFKARFIEELQHATQAKLRCWQEVVSYQGVDDLEEREQLVVAMGRTMVFCHIYQYQNDLYVGWNGYLNEGQWQEVEIARGIDCGNGCPTSITLAIQGTHPLSEYDLDDLNFTMECIHAHLCHHVRRLVDDKQIRQAIDYQIVRGDRQHLLKPGTLGTQGIAVSRFGSPG
ncbi:MAG: hypothetical protein WCO56_02590 [Verrucomicrobiota bacterium]